MLVLVLFLKPLLMDVLVRMGLAVVSVLVLVRDVLVLMLGVGMRVGLAVVLVLVCVRFFVWVLGHGFSSSNRLVSNASRLGQSTLAGTVKSPWPSSHLITSTST